MLGYIFKESRDFDIKFFLMEYNISLFAENIN